MKKMLLFLVLINPLAFAQEGSDLEKRLDALHIPDDQVIPVVSAEKLYAVNTRYSSLVNRHEITLQGADNLTADSHLSTQQAALAYRYHLNSKWSFGIRYSLYTNKLTSAGSKLFDDKQILPDTDFALNTQEIFVSYNTMYGKLRWSESSVVYFDQYLSLGGGKIELASGKTNMAFADLGLSFWLGKHMSTRIGVKNEFFKLTQLTGERNKHNAMTYLEIGYLFGSGDPG